MVTAGSWIEKTWEVRLVFRDGYTCKNMDPRSAGQDWINSLQDPLVGPPDISDIRGKYLTANR